MWGMKFNEKELAIWSTTFVADREGLLEKKGAGRGQGYKQRWFRLKGNLLFYFRVDDAGQWQETGEPLGVIILERCRVNAYEHESRPYTFALNFENDDSRSYLLSASSQQELEGWVIAIKAASYEGLRTMLYKLQKKLMSLTGEDPLLDKGVSVAPGAGDASPSLRNKHTVRRSAYLRSPQIDRAKRINSLQVSNQVTGPQYELSLSCVKLPVDVSGEPPSTLVRIRSYASPHDNDAHSTLSHTEVVKSCCNPSYSHLVLMEVGLLCPEAGLLEFEVFSVDSATVLLDELERSTCPIDSGNVVLRAASPDRDPSRPEHIELRMGRRIGRAEYLVSMITRNTAGKELKLPLSEGRGSLVCGFLHVLPLKLEDIMTCSPRLSRRNAIKPLDRGSPLGVLPPIMSHPFRCHFSFPTTDQHKMKVIEEMAESVFNVQVPMELLRCYGREDRTHLEELYTIGALEETWLRLLQEYQGMLFETIGSYNRALKELGSVADTCGFKPSPQKKDIALTFLPCNLHVQRMRVQPMGKGEKAYSMVTFGCPAHHLDGFKNGGLKRLLSECRSSPSFISRSEGKASTVKASMAGLLEIQKNICHYKNALFRASANAWPQDMNDAIIGISKQVQRLLWQMQSSVVSEAIEGLIMARPPAMGEKGEGAGGGGSKRETLSKEAKRQSLKRHSIAVGVGGAKGPCTCGKCCRCIPSPSDWVWNGSQFVQVSTREWKLADSCESVQRTLVALVEAVELATKKVVEQQHEAVASEVGYTLTTFQPSYVWSSDLIPLFSRLNQTLDGMLRVATSSLSFSLVQLDSYVQGLKALKRRRDVVFSQALTSLVTCFYLVLSQHLTDAHFLRQIREIGFLVQYESLLSSLGDESGMLEDMYIGILELGSVTFQLAELTGTAANVKFDFHLSGTRDSLTVRLLLDRAYLSGIPDEKLRVGERIAVVPVIFTQGVNEKQTLANIKQHIQLQEEINLESIGTLSAYVDKYQRLTESTHAHQEQATHAEALLKALKQSYATHKSKNIEFLLKVGELCRQLKGGRLVCCKSGKDRTSMSVTLEECCLLRNNHDLLDSTFMTTLQTLRSHGTRLENCLKNTGHKCYHFNQLQLMLLPRLLTPPLYTCRDPE